MIISGMAQIDEKVFIGHEADVLGGGKERLVLKFSDEKGGSETNRLVIEIKEVSVGGRLDVMVVGS